MKKGIMILGLVLFTMMASAQKMNMPMNYQFQLIMKTLAYEGRLNNASSGDIVLGVVYNSTAESRTAKNEFFNVFEKMPVKSIGNKTLKMVPIQFTTAEEIIAKIESGNVNVLYISPGMTSHLADIKELSIQKQLVTITGVESYVNEHFVMIGLKVHNKKPKIMVNLNISRDAGAQFSANFLKLCEVVR
ncbi:MAG: hypothetical protein Kow00108_04610 [Calditrichia bacterium]